MWERTQVYDDFYGKLTNSSKSTTFEPKLRPILPIGTSSHLDSSQFPRAAFKKKKQWEETFLCLPRGEEKMEHRGGILEGGRLCSRLGFGDAS